MWFHLHSVFVAGVMRSIQRDLATVEPPSSRFGEGGI